MIYSVLFQAAASDHRVKGLGNLRCKITALSVIVLCRPTYLFRFYVIV